MRTSTRRKTNRSISPAVIVHTAQPVQQSSDPNQLIQQLAQQMAQALIQQQQIQPDQNRRNTLTVKEALEEVFENSISEYKLYAMLRAGTIPHVKIGAKYLLRRDTLEGWMRQQEQGAGS
ncbi:excisionase family DNA-binding protein [Brevibacillus porteri]|uniref:Helix-turn-helix domain-containing protein n=1 Tax=Brevibacillus porteri TaxID=2126350 RepID=A0ABX5FKQ0_9BACL|nr:helix-turn-helix domain-containing protein [Brevibacillus porteri]MED1802987.1 helix-turn-helix domain-containing protein [Brevibacillus porteri]MED2134653.1 helix-turn-helix domain-containing protein [Brevibacillus porteri]MED2748168.1 helix-turn-helix domain-containing protein [Brevibacillus porteri]MED2817491.1 helix-turn-helix domain-containing protein [Brevibacillus porteri]MED2897799.1 helix-turn-helix domain-containing protein [Brevibacillus porteri]